MYKHSWLENLRRWKLEQWTEILSTPSCNAQTDYYSPRTSNCLSDDQNIWQKLLTNKRYVHYVKLNWTSDNSIKSHFIFTIGACPTAHRSTFLSHCSGPVTGQLLDNFRLNDRATFRGSIFNADPLAPGHVTSCLQLTLFGCSRAICELKGIYNV